jgi:hypothetical protein
MYTYIFLNIVDINIQIIENFLGREEGGCERIE